MSDELRPDHIDVLLIALLRSDAFAKKAATWLTRDHLDGIADTPIPGILWAVAKHFAIDDEIKRIPTLEEMRVLLPTIVRDHVEMFGGDFEGTMAMATAVIDGVAGCGTDMVDMATGILRQAYIVYVERSEMEKAFFESQASGNWEAVRKVALKTEADKSGIANEKVAADPLKTLDKVDVALGTDDVMPEEPRILTGVDVIDTLHRGRGAYRGFMHLLLGPTSGGKTIMAHQLMASMTSLGHTIAFLSTEEDLDTAEETKSRLFAACSDVTTDEWSAAGNDPRRLNNKLSAEHIQRLRDVRARTSFLSFDSSPSWDEIEARLHEREEKLKGHFDAIIVDWAGPLAVALQAAEKIQNPHEALERLSMYTQSFAKKSGSAVFLLHQLASASCEKKGTFGPYTEFDSQNCKKMTQYSAATYVIAPADKSMRIRFIGPKLRFDIKNTEVVAQLNPTHSRIDYLESKTVQGSKFVDKKSGAVAGNEGRAMPTLRRA